MDQSERKYRWQVIIAFALVYFFWGSSYLGIRVGIEHIAPALLSGTRFLVAGVILLAWCAITRRRVRITRDEAVRLALIGILLLSIQNVVLAWSELWVPTGLAALIISVVPLWFLVLETWVFPGEHHMSPRALIGLALGAGGIVVLLWPGLRHSSAVGQRELFGSVCLIGASLAWALGSVLSKRWKLPVDPFTATSYQMIFGGLISVLMGTALGDWKYTVWTWRGAAAMAYLVVFCSLAAFTAYIWLLERVPTAKLATYAYVNPVVAVFLGWLVLHEAVTGYILAGTGIIIMAVALVTGAKLKLKTRVGEPCEELRAAQSSTD